MHMVLKGQLQNSLFKSENQRKVDEAFSPCMLRYLSEFLYAWLMSTLSRADSSQMAEERILEEQLKVRSSKKSKKKKKGFDSPTIIQQFQFYL